MKKEEEECRENGVQPDRMSEGQISLFCPYSVIKEIKKIGLNRPFPDQIWFFF